MCATIKKGGKVDTVFRLNNKYFSFAELKREEKKSVERRKRVLLFSFRLLGCASILSSLKSSRHDIWIHIEKNSTKRISKCILSKRYTFKNTGKFEKKNSMQHTIRARGNKNNTVFHVKWQMEQKGFGCFILHDRILFNCRRSVDGCRRKRSNTKISDGQTIAMASYSLLIVVKWSIVLFSREFYDTFLFSKTRTDWEIWDFVQFRTWLVAYKLIEYASKSLQSFLIGMHQ